MNILKGISPGKITATIAAFMLCAMLASNVFAQAAAKTANSSDIKEEFIEFPTDDEWNIKARYYPATKSTWTLVLVHGQRNSSSEWKLWFPYLREAGIGYLALDLRGHGRSLVNPVGSTTTWRRFPISGLNNEYNKMVRDVEGAIAWLVEKGVPESNIVLAGTVLGANLSIKTAALHPDIAKTIAISPALNANDVLTVNPLRTAYGKRPLLLVGGTDRDRQYKELILINDLARTACGIGNVTVMLEYSGLGQELITKYNIKRLLAWLDNSSLPSVITFEDEDEDTETEILIGGE
ncbi:MAG: alpha/beta fold hydrolase [Elusimicrobiales bacterium]|nr:alpha/beta fold hydrolase [Elusimicrobiales bacterium]